MKHIVAKADREVAMRVSLTIHDDKVEPRHRRRPLVIRIVHLLCLLDKCRDGGQAPTEAILDPLECLTGPLPETGAEGRDPL
jgi:hypothetical protein